MKLNETHAAKQVWLLREVTQGETEFKTQNKTRYNKGLNSFKPFLKVCLKYVTTVSLRSWFHKIL